MGTLIARLPPSALLLIAANLLPIFGVIFWNWSPFKVLFLFWLETLVVGAISALKMVFAYPGSFLMWMVKLFCFPFIGLFLIPYVIFVVVLGMLVVFVFASDSVPHAIGSVLTSASSASGQLTTEEALQVFRHELDGGMLVAIAGLAASHLFSFFWYYFAKGECNRVGLGELVIQPVARVWLMSMALNLGAFGVLRANAPLWILAPLIAFKTAIDLYTHLREHRRLAQPAAPATSPPPETALSVG